MEKKERLLPIDDVTTINAIHIDRDCAKINVNTSKESFEIPYSDEFYSGMLAILKVAHDDKCLAISKTARRGDIVHVAIGFNGNLMEVYSKTYDRIAVLSGEDVRLGLECLVHTANGVLEDVIHEVINKILD